MPSRRSDIGPFGTQREEESSYPQFNIGDYSTARRQEHAPDPNVYEQYWNTDPGGGFNPMKGFLANVWDMARDPVWFMSGNDQSALEKTAALAYNSFLSTVSAGYLEGRHLTAPENKTLQSFAQALGTMAGFAAMLGGPTKLLNFLKVPKSLHNVVTGGVYGFGKKTGYGMDGLLSHDDIAARFKGAVMDGGMFAGFHFASKGLGRALSMTVPGAIKKAPGIMGTIQHGTPFGAFEAGMTLHEGGDAKEALARGLGGFMGGGVFGALGGRRGAKAVREMEQARESLQGDYDVMKERGFGGREPTALEPDRIPGYLDQFRRYREAAEMGPQPGPAPQRQGMRALMPGPRILEPIEPEPRALEQGGLLPLPERASTTIAPESYESVVAEVRRRGLDLLAKHKQSKRGQKQSFARSLIRARDELYEELREHPRLRGRAREIANDVFRNEYEALATIGEFEDYKKNFAKEFKAVGIPEPVVRTADTLAGREAPRIGRQVGGEIRKPEGEVEGKSIDTLSEYRATRKGRRLQPVESEPVSRGTARTGDIPGLRKSYEEYLEALESQDLKKQTKLRNYLLFDLEKRDIEVRGDESVTELDRLVQEVEGGRRVPLGEKFPVETGDVGPYREPEIPAGEETARMKKAKALDDGRTFFIDGKEYSLEPNSITDQSLRLTDTEGNSVLVEQYEISGRGRSKVITGDGVEAVPARPPGTIQAREAETKTRVPGKVEQGEAKAAQVREKVGKAPEYIDTDRVILDMYNADVKTSKLTREEMGRLKVPQDAVNEAKQRLTQVKQRGRTLLQENKGLEPKRAGELAKTAVYQERARRTYEDKVDDVALKKDRIARLEAEVESIDQQRKDAEEQRRIREQPEEVTETEADVLGERDKVRQAVSVYEAETRTKTQLKRASKAMKNPVINELVRKIHADPGTGANSDQLYKELQRLGYKGQELTDTYGDLLSPDTKRHSGVQPGELIGIERPSEAAGAIETNIGQDALTESLSVPGREGAASLVATELIEADGRTSDIYPDPARRPSGEAPTIGRRSIVSQDITRAKRGQVWRDPATEELYLNVFQTRIQEDGKTWIPEPDAYDSTASSEVESGAWLGIHVNRDGTLGTRGVRAIKADNMVTWDNLGRQSTEMENIILENVADAYSRAMFNQQRLGKVRGAGGRERGVGRGKRTTVKQTQRQAAEALKVWQAKAYKAGSLNALNRIRAEVGLDPLAEMPKAHDRRVLTENEMVEAFGLKPDGSLYGASLETRRDQVTGSKTYDVYNRVPMETGVEELRATLDLRGRGGERPVGRFHQAPRKPGIQTHPLVERGRRAGVRTEGEDFTPEQIVENMLDYDTWYERNVGKKKERFEEIDKEAERETTPEERRQIEETFNEHERMMYDEMTGEYIDVMAEAGRRVTEAEARDKVLEAMIEGKVPPELEAYLRNRC